ncbi:acetolactate synthase small subunit [Clostridium massiliamazoniense]|uniref:acetolactate synthase small subunit n=1 Tax=Clostridium massiliamazoniense TaxID=1347366 RepID=UPI0006D83CB8|nr:acetolactate synthase small subunit [Clostridium massiliamazoniense]
MERHVLSVLVSNSSGVLSRVSGLFSRRGFNIESLTVGKTQDENISRMTITLTGNDEILDQFIKQLNKLQDVKKIININSDNSVCRELVLIKVKASQEERGAINEIVNIFRCKIVDIAKEALTIELTGDESKVTALINLMKDYGIKEIVRTGIAAIERGSKEISSYGDYLGKEY